MSYSKLPAGKNPPDEVYVVIENPVDSNVKYELDKETGLMIVDRFLNVAMHYPGNYGFIPNTLSEDGDPVDVLVLGQTQVLPGAVVAVRPIGVLLMEDEQGMDEKIIAVPADRLNAQEWDVEHYADLPEGFRKQIEHFFAHYKDLEDGKWVKLNGSADADEAKRLINEGIDRASAAKAAAASSSQKGPSI